MGDSMSLKPPQLLREIILKPSTVIPSNCLLKMEKALFNFDEREEQSIIIITQNLYLEIQHIVKT